MSVPLFTMKNAARRADLSGKVPEIYPGRQGKASSEQVIPVKTIDSPGRRLPPG
jgi:hypothetical protein